MVVDTPVPSKKVSRVRQGDDCPSCFLSKTVFPEQPTFRVLTCVSDLACLFSRSLPAAFNSSGVQGEVLLSSPTVVEWRFSPTPRPAVRVAPASITQEEPATATTTATKHEAAVAAVSSRRRSWLRRQISRLEGDGRGGGGDVDRRSRMSTPAAESDHRERTPVEGGVLKGGAAHYVVSLLPLDPNRTKVFARCVRVEY